MSAPCNENVPAWARYKNFLFPGRPKFHIKSELALMCRTKTKLDSVRTITNPDSFVCIPEYFNPTPADPFCSPAFESKLPLRPACPLICRAIYQWALDTSGRGFFRVRQWFLVGNKWPPITAPFTYWKWFRAREVFII